MKHYLPFLFTIALSMISCNQNEQYRNDKISVAWNTYEKIYESGEEKQVWSLVFSSDSLHTYWCDKLEVSASFIQKGTVVNCTSDSGNNFTIIAHEDYVIYDDKYFTKKR